MIWVMMIIVVVTSQANSSRLPSKKSFDCDTWCRKTGYQVNIHFYILKLILFLIIPAAGLYWNLYIDVDKHQTY